MRSRPAPLWICFLAAHVIVAWLGWVYPSQPMGDVVLVYEPWAGSALAGGAVVGITEPWVYPQLALVPMLLVKVLSLVLVPLLGVSNAYLVAWAVLVVVLDGVALRVLLGRRPARPRRTAGWFWTAAVLLLGPVGMYRIDAVALPIAVAGAVWLVRRPRVGAALLVIGAWIKIWPGAMLLAAVIALRTRIRVLAAAAATAAVVVVVLILLGGGANLLGFLGEQTGRGLQIESVAATPYLWMARAGAASIAYSFDILTFQVDGPGAVTVAAVLTPVMVLVVAALVALAAVQAVRGARPRLLVPPTALVLVTALIVTNKVGSPQFQTWLIAPVILWLVLDRAQAGRAAVLVLVLVLCGLTCLIYPLTYDALLTADLVPVLLLSARNVLLLVLLGVGIRRLAVIPTRNRR